MAKETLVRVVVDDPQVVADVVNSYADKVNRLRELALDPDIQPILIRIAKEVHAQNVEVAKHLHAGTGSIVPSGKKFDGE